jgi:hypothetical protein
MPLEGDLVDDLVNDDEFVELFELSDERTSFCFVLNADDVGNLVDGKNDGYASRTGSDDRILSGKTDRFSVDPTRAGSVDVNGDEFAEKIGRLGI